MSGCGSCRGGVHPLPQEPKGGQAPRPVPMRPSVISFVLLVIKRVGGNDMVRRVRFFTVVFLIILVLGGKVYASGGMKVTNEMIYTKLLEIEKRQAILEAQFREFKEQVDKRFEQVDKRFEDVNKRFEDMNKRFEDMNKRFEDMNKRFEDMNKRFEELREDMNKRFEQMMKFMELMLLIFTSLVVAVIGFAYWDRRTIIRKAKEESVEEVGNKYNLSLIMKLIEALRELAREDERVARVLRQFDLL
jgi:TolA-binding protein